jgi:hypothetical protein
MSCRIAGDRAQNRSNGRAWITTKVKLRGRSRPFCGQGASAAPKKHQHLNNSNNRFATSQPNPLSGQAAAARSLNLLFVLFAEVAERREHEIYSVEIIAPFFGLSQPLEERPGN